MIPQSLKQIHLKEYSFRDNLKAGFDLWRANFNTLVLIFASIAIPVTFLNHALSKQISGVPLVLIQSSLNAVSYVVTTLASATVIESFLLKHRMTYAEALTQAGKKFFPALIVGVLFEVGASLATFFLIVPGLLFVVVFGFALPSVVLRNLSGLDAFQYSYKLTRPRLSALSVKFLGILGVVAVVFLATWPLSFLQKTFPSLLSGVLFHVLFSLPIILANLTYLNYDYLTHGFSGEMNEHAEDIEVSQSSLKPGDLNPYSLQALQARVKQKHKFEIEQQLQSNKKFDLNRLKQITQKVFKNKTTKEIESLHDEAEATPQDMRIKQKIAEAYYKQGKIDESANAFLEMARHYESENFLLKSIKTYKNILQIKPDLIEVNLKLADLYKKLNMNFEASNQYRIAIASYAVLGNKERALQLSEDLVRIDPSQENKTKLAEIYQINGMKNEALKQYEELAKMYRIEKKYDKLMHIYELILPHRPNHTAIIKDLCILHLRNQNPHRCLQIIDQYKLSHDDNFKELLSKAHMMVEVLKRQKTA